MQAVATFDTSILISAEGWGGKPLACLGLAQNGTIIGLTCKEILDEFVAKAPVKLNYSASEISATVSGLLVFMQMVVIPNTLHGAASDPKDDMVLECAVVGGATHIITGDRRHLLKMGSYQGIQIVSPAAFLQQVGIP